MSRRFSITRRGLFRGVGTATLVAGCGPKDGTRHPAGDGIANALAPGEIGPDEAALEFSLNGKQITASAEPRTTLLALLRDELDVTGPKEVCDRGACSACTVMVDGLPRNACMMLAHDVAGSEVVTVEGLADSDHLTKLQQAFVRHDAMQCGFCTSGMVMSCSALLQRSSGSRITKADVERAISGNLCRCGTYPNVVAAVLETAEGGHKGGA